MGPEWRLCSPRKGKWAPGLGVEVNVDGLRKGADHSKCISVQTLFTRTLRSLMFDNECPAELRLTCLTCGPRNMVELASQAAEKALPQAPLLELGADGWLVMANINAHLMERM